MSQYLVNDIFPFLINETVLTSTELKSGTVQGLRMFCDEHDDYKIVMEHWVQNEKGCNKFTELFSLVFSRKLSEFSELKVKEIPVRISIEAMSKIGADILKIQSDMRRGDWPDLSVLEQWSHE